MRLKASIACLDSGTGKGRAWVGNLQGVHVIVWIAVSTISPTINFAFLFKWVEVFKQ